MNGANFFLTIAISATILFSASCKKDKNDIGLNLVEDDQLNAAFTDSITLITRTIAYDSVKTSIPSSLICGNFTDSYFGSTTASFFTEVFPNVYNITFGTNPVIDSCVLSLVYKGFYGTPAPINFKVHQLTERIYKDTIYYSNQTKTFNSTPIADFTTEPNTEDSVNVGGTNRAPQLRLKITNTAFLSSLLNSANYTNQETFLTFMNGLYITANGTPLSSSRCAYYFNSSDAYTRLTLYYKNDENGTTQQSFVYNMGGNTARFNQFLHNYNAAPQITTQTAFDDTVSTQNFDFIYLQGLGGLKAKINMPNLKSYFANKNVFINKAELVIKADQSTINSFFSVPASIAVVGIDSEGVETIIPDQLLGSSYYGGQYDASKKQYVFNIARYIQQVLTGDITDRGLYIVPIGGAVFGNRVVLGGGSNPTALKMRLKITYTKI
jgi:hypothetical protein